MFVMARIEIARNELEDPALARQFEDEIAEAAEEADPPADGPLTCTILDEGLHAEIELQLPAWTERVPVPYPPSPGEVRRALERVFRDFGLVA
jgi:hypothetical protein